MKPTPAIAFRRPRIPTVARQRAEARTKAKESSTRGDVLYEQLLARTREQATAGILHSPDDLPAEGDYLDDSGMPSLDKIRAAAEALAQAKPYLSVPHGDIAQGARESEAQVSFGDLIRGALR